MNLINYDGKLVRITDINNDQYEGICSYNNEEFNECEYGTNEESLDIICIKFYKSDIKKVEIIDKFSKDYSKFEESIIEYDLIDEVFVREEDEHIYRLLKYIVDKNIKIDKKLLDLLKNSKDKRIMNLVKKY